MLYNAKNFDTKDSSAVSWISSLHVHRGGTYLKPPCPFSEGVPSKHLVDFKIIKKHRLLGF